MIQFIPEEALPPCLAYLGTVCLKAGGGPLRGLFRGTEAQRGRVAALSPTQFRTAGSLTPHRFCICLSPTPCPSRVLALGCRDPAHLAQHPEHQKTGLDQDARRVEL